MHCTSPAFATLRIVPELRPHRGSHAAASRRRRRARVSRAAASPVSESALGAAMEAWGLRPDMARLTPLVASPPLLRAARLLPGPVCDALVDEHDLGRDASAEADLYLNYRVNSEVGGGTGDGVSEEAAALLAAWGVPRGVLAAADRSGFRRRVDTADAAGGFRVHVLPAVERLLGLGGREAVFQEGGWVRPSRRTYVVRDVTVVHYSAGEGVSPHVDGKDATVLVYLSGEGESSDRGGATCFPEVGVRVLPAKGDALVYWSKTELLHYAERVTAGDKWIMQLLIDFRVRADEGDVDYATGQVFGSS